LPAPSSGLGVVNVDDLLYIVGGMGTTVTMPPVSKTARFTPADYGTVAPVVNITSPTNDAIYVEDSLPLTFTINRPSDQITKLSYSLDDNARIDNAGNVTLSNLPNGAHTIKVYVETQYSSVVGEYFASSYADIQFIISASTPTSSLIPTISNPTITKSPSQSPSLTISPTPTVTAPNNNLPIDTLVYWIVVIFAVIAISIAAVTLILKTRHKR
jgi:hypothetical protein